MLRCVHLRDKDNVGVVNLTHTFRILKETLDHINDSLAYNVPVFMVKKSLESHPDLEL